MTPQLFAKYLDDIARPTRTLIQMAPADKLGWVPGPQNFMTLGQLLHHLAGCPALFPLAVRDAMPAPEEMPRITQEDLKNTATPDRALRVLQENLRQAKEAVGGISERDWGSRVIRVPWAKPMLLSRVLVDLAGHWLNHKMQLFFYLKMLGYPVNTMALYVGEAPAARA